MVRRHYIPDPPPQAMRCHHAGCEAEGVYRAPKSPSQLNEFYWFCLDHVREYNKSWDFYAGMNTDQIERQVRFDTVWQRPTWPLGRWATGGGTSAGGRRFGGVGDTEFMPDDVREAINARMNAAEKRAEAEKRRRARKHASREEAALAVLDLVPPVTWAEIRTRYKALVKRLHPDLNGGDKSSEEQLKLVNQAYGTLKAAAAEA